MTKDFMKSIVRLYLRASCFPEEQLKWHTFQLYLIYIVVRAGYAPPLLSHNEYDRKVLFKAKSVNESVSGNGIWPSEEGAPPCVCSSAIIKSSGRRWCSFSCPGRHGSNWIAMSKPLYPPSLIFYLKIIIYWLSWNLGAVKSKGVLISLEKTLQAPVIRSHFHCLPRFKSVIVGLDWFRVRQISPFVLPELIFSTTSGPFYLWMTFLPVIDMSKVGAKAFYIHG